MARVRWLKQWTVRVAVLALLLQTAVPMLASAAAHLRGVPVAQVCEVYGVPAAMPDAAQGHHGAHDHHVDHASHDDSPPDHDPHSDEAHKTGHCALTALAALAPHDEPPAGTPRADRRVELRAATASFSVADACAAWAARLRHGPPRIG